MRIGRAAFAASLLVFLACGGAVEDEPIAPPVFHRVVDVAPAPAAPDMRAGTSQTSGTASLLVDHKGRVVPTMKYYVVYWGTGFSKTTQSLYTTFLGGLGASSYWSVDTQYLRGATNHASYMQSFADTAHPPAATVTDTDLRHELSRVIGAGQLPYDANGLYFVITPKTTKVCLGTMCSCSEFCGYHSAYADAKGVVLYSSIPSAAACPRSCGVFPSDASSPNANVEADEGVSVIAHEAE